MKKKRLTLCKECHDKYYDEYELPKNSAAYMATGYCSHCEQKGSAKRYILKESSK
jgi:hypothetical protein